MSDTTSIATDYHAIRSIGGKLSLLWLFPLSFCTVTDFSARTLPIGVKFCTVVRRHLRQVFSHFGGIAPGMAKFWESTGTIWWDMLLAEALVLELHQLLLLLLLPLRLIIYFNRYDCVYTDLVLSGCVVIFKIFYWGLLYDFSVMCILFMYCCKHVRLTCV